MLESHLTYDADLASSDMTSMRFDDIVVDRVDCIFNSRT